MSNEQEGLQASDRGDLPLSKRRCVSPSRHPHIQKNLQTFKQTFQKPCQIYKFLKEYWKVRPLFLNRTLNYTMNDRRCKTAGRKAIKLDQVVRRLSKKQTHSTKLNNGKTTRHSNGSQSHQNAVSINNCDSNNIVENSSAQSNIEEKVKKICYYDWICSDSISQKTRSYSYTCPWCERGYNFLDSLLTHLRCCHPRFNFNLVNEDGQSVIEMTLNTSYDGSYCGFKYPGHDLRRDFKFTPEEPERRTPTTQLIFFKPKKKRNIGTNETTLKSRLVDNGDTFSYDDGEADIDVCSGRLYYHTSTCLPVKPNEVDIDSEADMDPDWLRERTQLMIDEFTDVNEGEKEILKLWNVHIMKNYKYKGDNMIRQACLDFVELEGPTILSKKLCKNFTLHLANLYDFGLIGSGDIIECTRMLRKLRPQISTSSPTKTTGRVKLERNSNEHCQHSSPAKRALLNASL